MKNNGKILLFRIANGGHLYFEGVVKSILDFAERHLQKGFIEDDVEKPFIKDCCGNVVMDADDYQEAAETGIGRIELDGDYETWYTERADELSDKEVEAVLDSL